jgi:hypothetical protein
LHADDIWRALPLALDRDGGDGRRRFRLARSETQPRVSWMRAAEHVRKSRQPLRLHHCGIDLVWDDD